MKNSVASRWCSLLLGLGLGLACGAGQAGVIRVTAGDFKADAGFIGFHEIAIGTSNPTYAPSLYGGKAGAPTVSFGGFFLGQSLSATPLLDCPNAPAKACVVGDPLSGLSLDPKAAPTSVVKDSANKTTPVLSGSPIFNGPIAVLFSVDLLGVGFDAGFFDARLSTGITAFARDGSLLGTVTNMGLGVEFLGLVVDDGVERIAGVLLDLVGAEPAGFAIDNLRFARLDQVVAPLPPVLVPAPVAPASVPEPSSYALVALGLFGLGAMRRSRR